MSNFLKKCPFLPSCTLKYGVMVANEDSQNTNLQSILPTELTQLKKSKLIQEE